MALPPGFRYSDRSENLLGHGQDFFFGGYAGTGKTTVLPAVIDEMGLHPDEVAFCAPTGKAAKVMGGKLRDFGMSVVPQTIHKLIYMPQVEKAEFIASQIDKLRDRIHDAGTSHDTDVLWEGSFITMDLAVRTLKALEFDLEQEMDHGDGPTFGLRPVLSWGRDESDICKLIVVDEGSMVGTELANDLASFGIPILVFGDPGQLPPVNDEYGFNCEQPDTFLTEIHRQAQDNPIIHLATQARQGKNLKPGDYGDGVEVVKRQNDNATLDMDRDAMVLCGTHKKRWSLTSKIRKELGYIESGPCEGEPLIVCRNSQKNPNLVNGTIVKCLTEHGDLIEGRSRVELQVAYTDQPSSSPFEIECVQGLFEEHLARKRNAYSANYRAAFSAKKQCEHLDWGHVLTCHKSQGSQWDDVIVHDESGAFREASSRWLYTAVTRAAKTLTVVV
jgi:exodeoxyribonuclease-5